MNNRFLHALQLQKSKTEAHNPLIAGTLGMALNGQTVVEVPDRPSYVYVQVRSSSAEVIEAFNQKVAPVYGLPVLIQWEGNRYTVMERDTLRYSNWQDYSAYLPRHASTHEWIGSAGDVVFVSQQQFLPLMPMPSGSLAAPNIIINDYSLMTVTGTFQYFPAQATPNLTVWNPSSPTGAIMVLISLDAVTGLLSYTVGSGSVFGNWLTGTNDVLPFVPADTNIGRYLPLCAVRLTNNTTTISWDNIYDLRPIYGATRAVGGGGGGGTSSSGLAVMNNGVLEDYATQLNLLGANFILNHSGTQAQLTILGGGGSSTSGSLLLDTSNGPLFGPLVIYEKNPSGTNQYFDNSTLVAYLSGTPGPQFGAAVEAVVWSTGSRVMGIYIDDEGAGGNSLYIGQMGLMDAIAFQMDSYINASQPGPIRRVASPTVQWTRWGNNQSVYGAPFLLINQQDAAHDGQPAIQLEVNNGTYTMLDPAHTGTRFFFPNPFSAPYHFDTFNTIPSGMVLSEWLNNGDVKVWIANSGLVTSREGFNIYGGGTYNVNGVPHTHVITGAAFNGPFPQPVFGIFGEAAGVPLGSGTILNVRGSNALFTISGTTLDLFITGAAGGGGFAGVDQIGFYAERAGVPLGTGTILNVRGQNFTFTLSGTTADLFLTGTPPVFPLDNIGVFGENNGVPLGTGTILNIRGQNYTYSISGTTLDLFITGSQPNFPQPVLGIFGENHGIPLGTGTILNVRGNGNAILSISGTTLDLFITGSPFPQEVIGLYGENAGVPLGTGSILNVRGATLSISGTTLDLFVTGSPFPQEVIGIFGENAGVPLGTGSILNVRGQNATLSISGTTLDLFITGTLPSGPAGGDLTGVYPNPQVMWGNGTGFYGTVFAPLVHAFRHESGGADPIPLDLLAPPAYPAGNYLDASTGSHGLMRELSGNPAKYIGGDGLEHDLPAVEEYYLDDSAFVTGTKSLVTTYPTGGVATISQLITSTTTGTPFSQIFLSQSGAVSFLGAQETRLFVTLQVTAGTKITYAYAQFLKYSSSGTETLIGTSNLQLISSSLVEYDLGMGIPDTAFDPSERMELKFFGLGQGAGGNPTITLSYDGTTSSRLEVGQQFRGSTQVTNNFLLGVMGQNQGINLGTGTTLNFVGAGVTATISGTVINVNIPGGAGGGGAGFGVFGEDEGVPLGTGSIMNFRGANVTASISGSTLDVFVTGTLIPWNIITTTGGVNMTPNQNYLTNNQGAQVALRLPASANIGDMIRVVGMSSGTWAVLQPNANSIIHFLHKDTSKGTAGSLFANSPYDAVNLVCVVRDNEWVVVSANGNIGVV